MVYDLKAVGDVACKIINNSRDLVIALHTKEGRLIKAADVSINKSPLRYDETTQTYRRDRYAKEGALQAAVNGVLYIFPIKKQYAVRRTFFQKLTQTVPLKIIVNPIKNLFATNKRRRYTKFITARHMSKVSKALPFLTNPGINPATRCG